MASADTIPTATLAREAMIERQLKPCGVVSPAVVAAFFAVPREAFVPPARAGFAYLDSDQPLGGGRAMMAPRSLGLLIEEARVAAGDKVLVVAAATGYAAALLARLGATVTALESDAALAAEARENLAGMAAVAVVEGPLADGWPTAPPYGLILVDGGVEALSDPLVAQLAEGGRAVAIVLGKDGVMRACAGRKAAGTLRFEPFADAAAPLLPEFRTPQGFRF